MNKLIISFTALVTLGVVDVSNAASMKMKLSGDIKNTYYLCLTNAGCVNLAAGAKGKSFPINSGNVDYIVIANAANTQMFPQQLPDSCAVTVSDQQTLTVTGKVSSAANNKIYISHLHCAIV